VFVAGNRNKHRGRSRNLPDPVCRHGTPRAGLQTVDGTHRCTQSVHKQDHMQRRKDTCTALLWFSGVREACFLLQKVRSIHRRIARSSSPDLRRSDDASNNSYSSRAFRNHDGGGSFRN
jgi:hypothetical protein